MKNKLLSIMLALATLTCVFSGIGINVSASVTPTPTVEIPARTQLTDVKRSDKTGIGAIYYHMWFKTIENWWQYGNEDVKTENTKSVQDARCLAPDKHHYRLPFFATINTSITKAGKINGSVSTGVPEFPEFTEEIWKQEMEYAIEAGVDFMAYLWGISKFLTTNAYKYHIKTKGLDGKIKMCAILQYPDREDINTMVDAMTEDYWYTVDGMPVVYIYGARTAATNEVIARIRRKVATAQKIKTGEVGKPPYIICMGMTSYINALEVCSRDIDAIGWYAINANAAVNNQVKAEWQKQGIQNSSLTIKAVPYSRLAEYGLEMMNTVSKVWEKGFASVSPLITLGYNVLPRIENPVSWAMPTTESLPYSGTYVKDPTPEEMTKNILDVLNFNKEKGFSCNTVLMYCWNEYSEGGWICPTLAVDKDGNVLKNADGTNKINRENLDAVKEGIALYREHEAEDAIYDIDGNKIKDIVQTTQNPSTTKTPDLTKTPNEEQQDNNGLLVWICLGGAVVVVAVAAVVVVIVLKKKKVINETEKTE